MSPDVPLEKEYIPLFRKALAAVADPVAAAAATEGEIVYLGTMEVRQGYLDWCDQFVASDLPAQARERMRQQRDAIRPYLDRRVLKGCVRHAGLAYEACIDMATGAVIDLAWGPWPPLGVGGPARG
jgi:hypothetical protein